VGERALREGFERPIYEDARQKGGGERKKVQLEVGVVGNQQGGVKTSGTGGGKVT